MIRDIVFYVEAREIASFLPFDLVDHEMRKYEAAFLMLGNVTTAVVALLAIRWSSKPADNEHPYGHHKAEYFSAVIEAC